MDDEAMDANKRFQVYGCLVTVQVINAGYNTLTHDALKKGKVDALIFSLYRDCMAYPLLQLGAFPVDGRLWPDREDIWKLFFLGLTGMFGNQFFYIMGLKYLSTDIAAVLNLAQAIFAAFIANAVGQEKLGWENWVGVALAIGGAIILLEPWAKKSSDEKKNNTAGYIFVLMSCVSMVS
jgi:drug/metabolite transporter (DMT)-like permease